MAGAEEVRKLGSDLSDMTSRVGRKAAAQVRRSTKQTEQLARATVPVRTGELQASIRSTTYGDGRSKGIRGLVTAGTDHAFFVEHGTYRTAPQPFLGPAHDSVQPDFVAAMEQITNELLT